jgi:hypothetical protein
MSVPPNRLPFNPAPRDFEGHPMPQSVPAGMRLELSRARVVAGEEDGLGEWMQMLNSRPEELQEGLSAERSVFEAIFRSDETDGSTWIYHLALAGVDGGPNDENIPVDADHATYSRRVKEPGWEELTPLFMLTPAHLLRHMVHWAETGTADRGPMEV